MASTPSRLCHAELSIVFSPTCTRTSVQIASGSRSVSASQFRVLNSTNSPKPQAATRRRRCDRGPLDWKRARPSATVRVRRSPAVFELPIEPHDPIAMEVDQELLDMPEPRRRVTPGHLHRAGGERALDVFELVAGRVDP